MNHQLSLDIVDESVKYLITRIVHGTDGVTVTYSTPNGLQHIARSHAWYEEHSVTVGGYLYVHTDGTYGYNLD